MVLLQFEILKNLANFIHHKSKSYSNRIINVMSFSEEYKKYLSEVILIIKENLEDLRQKQSIADSEEKEYIAGRLFSYIEVIKSLKSTLRVYGIKESDIGLDQIKV